MGYYSVQDIRPVGKCLFTRRTESEPNQCGLRVRILKLNIGVNALRTLLILLSISAPLRARIFIAMFQSLRDSVEIALSVYALVARSAHSHEHQPQEALNSLAFAQSSCSRI